MCGARIFIWFVFLPEYVKLLKAAWRSAERRIREALWIN